MQEDYKADLSSGTGNILDDSRFLIKTFYFGIFEIKIKLTLNNEIVEILEVKIKKDFLSLRQKLKHANYHDDEEIFDEEE